MNTILSIIFAASAYPCELMWVFNLETLTMTCVNDVVFIGGFDD